MTSRRNPAGLTMGVKLLLMISLLHKLSLAKECGDGFHESQQGICCKLCPAGTYKMYSCIHNGSRAACDLCPTGSFMDRDNWEEKCTQCNSCGPDEEVALACSVAQDTVCQCMKGLKRDADSGVCLNEKTHTDDAAATSAIVLACLLTLILVVFTVILLFRMRKPRWSTLKLKFNPSGVTNERDDVEMEIVDLRDGVQEMSTEKEEECTSQANDGLAPKIIFDAPALLHIDLQDCGKLDSPFHNLREKQAFDEMLKIDADVVESNKEASSFASHAHNYNLLPFVVSETIHEPTQAMGNYVSKECRVDMEILQSASGGLALEGVYLSGKLEDELQKRGKLLAIPQTFRLVGLVGKSETKQHDFVSFSEESLFEKTMRIMGFSSAVFENGRVHALRSGPISLHAKSLNLKGVKHTQTDNSYLCWAEYMYLPLASAHLQMSQLRLSETALNALINIENTLANTMEIFKSKVLNSMSGNFFLKFGSHANEGPLEFGGIFCRKASAKGFSSDQKREIQRLLSESLGPNIGADCDSCMTSDTGGAMATAPGPSGSEHHSPVLNNMVQTTVTTIGGDPDVRNLLQWKSAIASNNRTWSLIDRGTRFIPVWDIVLSNHECNFKDVLKFACDLQTAYTVLKNRTTNTSQEGQLAAIIVEAQSIMQDANQWKESDNEAHLDILGDIKHKLYECTTNNRSWIDGCLSHPALQEFLTRVVSAYRHSPGDKPERINVKMRRLLEPNIYEVENFPQRSSIMKWVYGSDTARVLDAELNALTETFTKTKERLKEATDASTCFETALNEAKVKGTNDVTFSLHSLCRCLREMNRVEEELVFVSAAAASGFSAKERSFHRLLDYQDVDCLQHQVDKAHSEYLALRSRSTLKAQAYVLLNGLTTGAQSNAWSPEEKEEHLEFMKSHLGSTIRTQVSNVVRVHDGVSIDWNRLEEGLKSLCAGKLNIALTCSQILEAENERNNTEFINLLKRLGLQKYYPNKMHTGDVCFVNKSTMCTKPPSTEQELVFCYLQKLIMVDYRARYVSLHDENTNNETTHNNDNSHSAQLNNLSEPAYAHAHSNIDDFLCDDVELSSIDDTRTHIHPMDLQMAIFQCGDNFVRQYIYTKLSFCQFALPLLVPNPCSTEIEFPLWAFRQIYKSWKYRDASTKTQQSKSCAIVNSDTPLVSFIRFGDSPTSKSQMLNSLLGKQSHGSFFHRHCRGSRKNGLLMEGVTEIAWYCPGGMDDDVFNDCIAFTNLHGDARKHRRQVKFLHEISSINVVLLSESQLNDDAKHILQEYLNSPKPFVFLCADKERIKGAKPGIKVKIAVKNRNEPELMDELKSTLNNLLAKSTQTINIDDCSNIARRHGFKVDEDNEDCKQGKSMADDLLSCLKDKPLPSMKETFLPLQGKLWHEWCKKDKEFTRLRVKGDQSVEEYRDSISMEKQSLRQAQLDKGFPLNDAIRTFIEILEHQVDTVKAYFLNWLKIYLDNLSKDELSQLHQEYHQVRREMVKSKKETNESSLLATKQAELQKISQKRDASSFGIDHLFREVGQIYEASQTLRIADTHLAALPGIAADFMLSGFPLELVDGDASHVPLTWIGSVLDKVIEKVGNKKLFVLSILGIQSSGKSTLLNAMFGLQFPVGAGRCTRGVYMQLVKVEEEFSTELGCDFVLIVDTEGIRAPELSNAKPTRDNELATFVIGLGNATVINIFGENPLEMQDILQIAVQAFLRMRQMKLSSSCVFVHQNVGDVTAQDNNEEARRRLQEKLDEMTRLAAEQEQFAVESFDEVIRFDVDSHVCYFAHLWEGKPPMAPPNPSYCQNVKDLKEMLLSISKRGKNVLKISEFKARIQDLWRALLTENFLFSFKNTLEIAAYSKLEEMYGKWTWSLRSHLIQEENKQYNIINNSTDVTSNLTRSMIEKSVLPKYNETRKEIETYFKGEDAELLTQWKTNFANRFETIKEDLVIDTYKKCTDLIEQKSALNSVDQNRSRYEDQLMKKCKDLASKLNTTDVKDVQLEKEFDTMWEESMDEVKNSVLAPKILNFRIEVQNILQKEFQIENGISTNVEKMFHNESREIQRNGIWDWLPFSRYQEQTNIFKKITEDAENAANVVIKHIENRKLGYNENNIHEVIKCVQETVDSCCEHNAKLKLTNTNRLDLAICILTNAEWKFQKIHDDFQRANDPLIYFSSKKEEYFNSFKIRCKGATNTTIFADTLCRKLKAAMHQAVCDQASLYIVDKMKSECQAFNGNRSRLQNYILIHLAEKEMFEEFNEYIQKPQQYFVKYITERVEEYCSAKENNKINKILKSCLELQKKLVVNVIADATTAVQTNKGDASSWLDEFSKRLDHKFNFPRHGLVIADYKDINDIAYLTDELTKAMETMVTQLNTQYSTASLRDLEHVRNKPHDMLCEQMSGCWAQCPFCDSLCTNTILNHAEDHCTPIHRPQAVTGWSWHETNFFCTDICTSLVASDILYVLPDGKIMPYKDYRTIGREHASWSITPDLTVQPYWKWFVCRFKSDLEEFYNLQFKGSGAIPDGWTKITKDEAIADLHKK